MNGIGQPLSENIWGFFRFSLLNPSHPSRGGLLLTEAEQLKISYLHPKPDYDRPEATGATPARASCISDMASAESNEG